MKTAVRCLLLLLAGLGPVRASATVLCDVSSTGTAFGGYDTLGAGSKDTIGTISVTCSGSIGEAVNYTIALGPGSGGFMARTMLASGSQLQYNLYADGAHTAVWGDGTSGTTTVSDNYTLSSSTITRQYTVYGEIPGQSGPKTGVYMDTLLITLTY